MVDACPKCGSTKNPYQAIGKYHFVVCKDCKEIFTFDHNGALVPADRRFFPKKLRWMLK